MRSLFLRILLWFGLAMVLAAVASFVVGVIAERRARDMAPPHLVQAFGVYSQTAADVFERDGSAAVAAYLQRVGQASGIHAVLVDERGAEVSGQPVPAGSEELAQRARETMTFVNGMSRARPLNAQAVRSPNGTTYVLIAEDEWQPRRPAFGAPARPGSFRFTLFSITRWLLPLVLVGGLFCYWLARYLSTPMVELRGVTQELAEGKLDARVNHKLLNRRDEIGHLGRDFNVMAGRIESLMKAQRRLLGDISHELRSPLARQGVALGLARRNAGPQATPALDRIEREAGRLNEMIGQLLTLSCVESGADRLENEEIDLAVLLKEVADDADFEARGRDRTVRIIRDEPLTIRGVFELVRSAIENVVRNAVRYTGAGTQVDIALTSETVNRDRCAVITVRDHGKGVPEESIKEIFRPFYRVEDDRDRKTGGTGLGLRLRLARCASTRELSKLRTLKTVG